VNDKDVSEPANSDSIVPESAATNGAETPTQKGEKTEAPLPEPQEGAIVANGGDGDKSFSE
jgi:hypothetical protein